MKLNYVLREYWFKNCRKILYIPLYSETAVVIVAFEVIGVAVTIKVIWVAVAEVVVAGILVRVAAAAGVADGVVVVDEVEIVEY